MIYKFFHRILSSVLQRTPSCKKYPTTDAFVGQLNPTYTPRPDQETLRVPRTQFESNQSLILYVL